MALFGTQEERDAKRKEKEEKDFKKLADRYHLTEIDQEDYDLIKNVARNMAGTGFAEFATHLHMGTPLEESIKIDRLASLQEQNWIIINQLGRLNKNLKKIIEQNEKK